MAAVGGGNDLFNACLALRPLACATASAIARFFICFGRALLRSNGVLADLLLMLIAASPFLCSETYSCTESLASSPRATPNMRNNFVIRSESLSGASNMCIHHFRGLFVLALALCAQSARAFLDPPYIAPANPVAGEPVSVSIYGGECDLVDYGINWPPPLTQQGNEITIHFTGIHEEDPEFCYYGLGTSTYPVGTFPTGSYTLHVERRYSTFNGWITETLGIIPFAVSSAPTRQAIEAPALTIAGFSALLLGLIAASLLKLRERLSWPLQMHFHLRTSD